jgi:hypothetical protein
VDGLRENTMSSERRVTDRYLQAKRLDSFWVVTNPTEDSEPGDFCFQTNTRGLGLIALGSGAADWNRMEPRIHTDVGSAKTDALLRFQRVHGEDGVDAALAQIGGLQGWSRWKPQRVAGGGYTIRAFIPHADGGGYEETNARSWAGARKEVAAFHRRGMDGFVIHPDGGKSFFHEVRSSGRQPTPHYGADDLPSNFPESPAAPSAESAFFDNPEKREVRELAQSGAITNIPEVAEEAAQELDVPESEAVSEAEQAPPTPEEVAAEPGGGELSTLNRFVVETEHPTDAGVPDGHEDVPKHPDIKASLRAAWWSL